MSHRRRYSSKRTSNSQKRTRNPKPKLASYNQHEEKHTVHDANNINEYFPMPDA
jgi:hypothetical protein